MLCGLPFYEELSIIKTNHAFEGYAESFTVEIIERKDSINKLEASKLSIKDLFSDLLNETKLFHWWNKNELIVLYRGENAVYEFIKANLKDCKYCKKLINKYFNKNLIMSEEEEHLFQQSNSCWICRKLIDNDEEKVD